MRQSLSAVLLAGALAFGGAAVADDDQPQHYEGKKPESLEEAVALLAEYNAKLEEILADQPLDAGQMEEVHRLSYTLENALNRINSEMFQLTKTLEDVHLASERRDAETVREQGRAYLSTAGKVVE